MISDVLSDAAASIREYLEHPATERCYDRVRIRVEDVLGQMDALRRVLDAPPTLTAGGPPSAEKG